MARSDGRPRPSRDRALRARLRALARLVERREILHPLLLRRVGHPVELGQEDLAVVRVDRRLSLAPGDLLAVGAAGAYGMAMSSNYNLREPACEVII